MGLGSFKKRFASDQAINNNKKHCEADRILRFLYPALDSAVSESFPGPNIEPNSGPKRFQKNDFWNGALTRASTNLHSFRNQGRRAGGERWARGRRAVGGHTYIRPTIFQHLYPPSPLHLIAPDPLLSRQWLCPTLTLNSILAESDRHLANISRSSGENDGVGVFICRKVLESLPVPYIIIERTPLFEK